MIEIKVENNLLEKGHDIPASRKLEIYPELCEALWVLTDYSPSRYLNILKQCGYTEEELNKAIEYEGFTVNSDNED